VVTGSNGKVANQENLVSLVTASGELKPTTFKRTRPGIRQNPRDPVQEGDARRGRVTRLLAAENVQSPRCAGAVGQAVSSAESGGEAAEASFKAAQSDLILQQANLDKAK